MHVHPLPSALLFFNSLLLMFLFLTLCLLVSPSCPLVSLCSSPFFSEGGHQVHNTDLDPESASSWLSRFHDSFPLLPAKALLFLLGRELNTGLVPALEGSED